MVNDGRIQVFASLMCANQARLLEELLSLEEAGVDGFHLDVMDGHFVPNFGLSIDVIAGLKKVGRKPMDVHLMVEYPEPFLERILDTGVEKISCHIESRFELARVMKLLDKYRCDLGIGVNPATPLGRLPSEVFAAAKYFLILTVNPGFPRQPIIPSVLDKVRLLTSSPHFPAQRTQVMIDGHVDRRTINAYRKVGVSMFVGGSTGLFCDGQDYRKNLLRLRDGHQSSSIALTPGLRARGTYQSD